MNVLVTGGTGFVGRGALPLLLEAGHDLRALVRAGSERKLPLHQRCTPITGNPLDVSSVTRALEGCDAVVHLLGIRRKETKSTGLTYDDVDVGSVRVMVEAMQAAGVRRILLLSAGAIGKSVYVQCKGRAEKVVRDAELAWTIYRPSFVLGPGQEWPRILEPALALLGLLPGQMGDVARRARAVTREELAGSMAWALDHPESAGRIYDVPAIREVAAQWRESRSHRIAGAPALSR